MTLTRSSGEILFHAELDMISAPTSGAMRTSSMYFASRKIWSVSAS